MTKEQVELFLGFISQTLADPFTYMSTTISPIVIPTIKWEFEEQGNKFAGRLFVEYVPRSDKKDYFNEFGHPYRVLLLKMETDTKENEDEFYTYFLNNFIRLMTWGNGDLDIENILRGLSDLNWPNHNDEEPVTFRSIMKDKGIFHKHTRCHWKEPDVNMRLITKEEI